MANPIQVTLSEFWDGQECAEAANTERLTRDGGEASGDGHRCQKAALRCDAENDGEVRGRVDDHYRHHPVGGDQQVYEVYHRVGGDQMDDL